jgi:hypothetical protein
LWPTAFHKGNELSTLLTPKKTCINNNVKNPITIGFVSEDQSLAARNKE